MIKCLSFSFNFFFLLHFLPILSVILYVVDTILKDILIIHKNSNFVILNSCNDRIQKIQTIKRMEELFICAAPHCFKSFLKKTDFVLHINGNHADLLPSNMEKDGNDSEAVNARKPTGSDSTVQAPPRPTFSIGPTSQLHDREAHRQQSRDQPPPRPVMQPKGVPAFPGAVQNHLEQQPDHNAPPGFDRRFVQQAFDSQGGMRQESGQHPDKQQGHASDSTFPEYPLQTNQPPNFAVPINQNPVLAPPQFGYPPFGPDGPPPFYGGPYEMSRPESVPEGGPEQGSLLGFPPGPAGGVNFAESYPRPWSMSPAIGSFDPSVGQGTVEGFMSTSDPQGRSTIIHGDYGRNPGSLPSNLPLASPTNKGIETVHSGSSMDLREGKGILAPQPMPLPPPPPFPSQVPQAKRGKFYPAETNNDGQSFGWQNEKRESFGSSRD